MRDLADVDDLAALSRAERMCHRLQVAWDRTVAAVLATGLLVAMLAVNYVVYGPGATAPVLSPGLVVGEVGWFAFWLYWARRVDLKAAQVRRRDRVEADP